MTETATDSSTPRNPRFILVSTAVAIGYWVIEAFLDSLLLKDVSFAMRLFPSDLNELWMRGLACTLFIAFGLYSQRVQARIHSADLMRAVAERRLQDALAKILAGYIPICSWCKKIRNNEGEWDAPESFITARTGVLFSHGMCPQCASRHFPDEAWSIN